MHADCQVWHLEVGPAAAETGRRSSTERNTLSWLLCCSAALHPVLTQHLQCFAPPWTLCPAPEKLTPPGPVSMQQLTGVSVGARLLPRKSSLQDLLRAPTRPLLAVLQMTELEAKNKEVAADSDSEEDFEEGMGDIDVEAPTGLTV